MRGFWVRSGSPAPRQARPVGFNRLDGVQASVLRRSYEIRTSLRASIDERSRPTGEDGKKEEKRREDGKCGCVRSIRHRALKSQAPQLVVKTKLRKEASA